jgi:hypothetical protein
MEENLIVNSSLKLFLILSIDINSFQIKKILEMGER